MKRPDAELSALLERGRVIRRVPDVVRARAMARARAFLAESKPSVPPHVAAPARHRRLRLALAAAICLAVGAAGATAALLLRAPQAPESPVTSRPPVFAPVLVPVHSPAAAPRAAAAQPIPVVRPHRPAAPVARESYAVELALLRRAQAAYAGRDFLVALALLADHGRRFPNGRLAEEREALRVRSLAGAGRLDEARHAVAVFTERFPRSVLLPRLREVARVTE